MSIIENQTATSFFFEARDYARQMANDEVDRVNSGLPAWTYYNAAPSEYEDIFIEYLGETFLSYIKNRKAKKGKAFVMDVMGQGIFSQSYDINGEVAITLVDFRDSLQRSADKNDNKIVIEGDVLKGSTWAKARRFIDINDDTNFKGFDLIVCRPLGGWYPDWDENYHQDRASITKTALMNRMVKLLSPCGGTLLASFPLTNSDHSNWTNQLQRLQGIEANGGYSTIKITRLSVSSLLKLPRLS